MALRITGNTISGWRMAKSDPMSFFEMWDSDAGVLLNTIDDANVSIMHNSTGASLERVRTFASARLTPVMSRSEPTTRAGSPSA